MDNMQETIINWCAKASHIIGSYTDIFKPYFFHPQSNENKFWVLKQLYLSCHLTSESALVLIANYRLWDTEMLIRSISEGTLKLLYLCLCDDEQRLSRIREYWIDIPRINDIKRHDRIKTFFSLTQDPDSKQWAPYRDLILSPEEYENLRLQYPKKLRKEIEHRWSFSEIMRSLSETNSDYKSLLGLAHGYGLGSHLVHQDGDAVGLIWDRTHRNDERRLTLEFAHASREISDVLTYTIIRSEVLCEIFGIDNKVVREQKKQNSSFFDEMNFARQTWWEIESEYQNGRDIK